MLLLIFGGTAKLEDWRMTVNHVHKKRRMFDSFYPHYKESKIGGCL